MQCCKEKGKVSEISGFDNVEDMPNKSGVHLSSKIFCNQVDIFGAVYEEFRVSPRSNDGGDFEFLREVMTGSSKC